MCVFKISDVQRVFLMSKKFNLDKNMLAIVKNVSSSTTHFYLRAINLKQRIVTAQDKNPQVNVK